MPDDASGPPEFSRLLALDDIKPDGSTVSFDALVRVDTPVEIDYYRNGGILQTVLRKLAGPA